MQFVQNFWDVLAAVAQSHFGPWLGLAILATIVTFGMTAWRRNTVDKALRAAASLGSKPLRLFDLSYGDAAGAVDVKVAVAPERLWSYDEIYLDHFRDKAGGALATYTNSVLRWDVLFAFCLASFIVLFWLAAVAAASFPPLFGRLAIFCECMGILYGFADIAEDYQANVNSEWSAPGRSGGRRCGKCADAHQIRSNLAIDRRRADVRSPFGRQLAHWTSCVRLLVAPASDLAGIGRESRPSRG